MTLYEKLKQIGVRIESHESDMYVPVTRESGKILKDECADIFISQIDKKPWYDVPGAFDPFWQKKKEKDNAKGQDSNVLAEGSSIHDEPEARDAAPALKSLERGDEDRTQLVLFR